MVNLASKLNETVTYWAPTGLDGYAKKTFAAPTTLSARWEDRSENIISPSGEQIISRSRVFLAQGVAIGGYLFLGTSSSEDPRTVDGALPIQQTGRVPNLRANQVLHTAFL